MRFKYEVIEDGKEPETIEKMSFKKLLKGLDKKKTYTVNYKNKKGNPQSKLIVNGKEDKKFFYEF